MRAVLADCGETFPDHGVIPEDAGFSWSQE